MPSEEPIPVPHELRGSRGLEPAVTTDEQRILEATWMDVGEERKRPWMPMALLTTAVLVLVCIRVVIEAFEGQRRVHCP